MYIIKETETPQGVSAKIHRIHNVLLTASEATITINSYAAVDSKLLVWQDTHNMPLNYFNSNTYPNNVYEWMTGEGPLSGGIIMDDMDDFQKKKKEMKYSVNHIREQKLGEGLPTSLGLLDTSLNSIAMLMLYSQQHVSNTIEWKFKDNSTKLLNSDDFQLLLKEYSLFSNKLYSYSWELKNKIDEAIDLETLLTIVVDEKWE